jgi:serine O-acetyltransferase
VSVGTGAKVLGNVTVGAGARIGANAVVIEDVPEGATVVGSPARPVKSSPAADGDGSGTATREAG